MAIQEDKRTGCSLEDGWDISPMLKAAHVVKGLRLWATTKGYILTLNGKELNTWSLRIPHLNVIPLIWAEADKYI